MKKELRAQYLERRNALPLDDLKQASDAISKEVMKLEIVHGATNVGLYVSTRSEAITHDIILKLISQGKRVYVPFLADGKMHFTIIKSLRECSIGAHGILEPDNKVQMEDQLDGSSLMIVPGIVFGTSGYRLGYGEGYYDRFLGSLKQKPFCIGICVDSQLIETVPHDDHDVPMDIVVTEKRVVIINSK